jgi:Fe-S-cluster containining protein
MAIAERRTRKIRVKPRREDLGKHEVLCAHCPAKCCRYFALPIEKPTDWEDFEFIRWFLLHDRASVFTEDGEWYLLVHNKCNKLGDDNLCRTYETRPKICRDYTTDNCEYEDDWVYDHYWETPDQVLEYAEAVLGPPKGRGLRGPMPERLKILQ